MARLTDSIEGGGSQGRIKTGEKTWVLHAKVTLIRCIRVLPRFFGRPNRLEKLFFLVEKSEVTISKNRNSK